MLISLLLGSVMILANMGIQVFVLVLLIRYFLRKMAVDTGMPSIRDDVWNISLVLLVLLAGHVVQFATWAALFCGLGEFSEFKTPF